MASMSSNPRALQELMKIVDAGLVVPPVDVDSRASLGSSRRRGSSYSRSRQTAPVAAKTIPLPVFSALDTDPSFEFSTAVSNSSASPASMVFSDGQLRAHQFPAVRSSPGTGSSQVGSPVLSSSMGSTKAGSIKRVSFAEDSTAGKTTAARSKKGGGLLGCMGSTCRLSRNEVVEPAMNANRKVVSV